MSLLDGFFTIPRKPSNRPAGACRVLDAVALQEGKSPFVLLMAASKCGTGKSTLCVHLAAQSGTPTLIVDTDIEGDQQSCIAWSKARSDSSFKVIPAKGRDAAGDEIPGTGSSLAPAAGGRRRDRALGDGRGFVDEHLVAAFMDAGLIGHGRKSLVELDPNYLNGSGEDAPLQ